MAQDKVFPNSALDQIPEGMFVGTRTLSHINRMTFMIRFGGRDHPSIDFPMAYGAFLPWIAASTMSTAGPSG